MKLATNLSKSSVFSPFLSKAMLCHLSFCFALRLSKLSVCMHLSKPVWIRPVLWSSVCTQMTSPSFLACSNFLITLKFCFTPAPFFGPHRSSELVPPGPKLVANFQPSDSIAEIEMGKAQAHLLPPPIPLLFSLLHILSLISRTNNQTAILTNKYLTPSMHYPHVLSEDTSLCPVWHSHCFPCISETFTILFLSIMGSSFGTDPRSSNDYSSVCKFWNKPWSQKDVIKLAKLQIKVTKSNHGLQSLIYEERLKGLSMYKLSQMMTKGKYGKCLQVFEGSKHHGNRPVWEAYVHTFLCTCDVEFRLHYCWTFLSLIALRSTTLHKDRANAPLRNCRLIYFFFPATWILICLNWILTCLISQTKEGKLKIMHRE